MFASISQARSFLDIQVNGEPSDALRVRKACHGAYGSSLSDKQWDRWQERVEVTPEEYSSGCLSYSSCVLLKLIAMQLSGNRHRKVLRRCPTALLLMQLEEYALAAKCDLLWPSMARSTKTGREVYEQIYRLTGRRYDRDYLRRRIGLRLRDKYDESAVQTMIDKLIPPIAVA